MALWFQNSKPWIRRKTQLIASRTSGNRWPAKVIFDMLLDNILLAPD